MHREAQDFSYREPWSIDHGSFATESRNRRAWTGALSGHIRKQAAGTTAQQIIRCDLPVPNLYKIVTSSRCSVNRNLPAQEFWQEGIAKGSEGAGLVEVGGDSGVERDNPL